MPSHRNSGFTLVELLIVVVVIVILATVTAVVYKGVDTKARNTQTAAAVKIYRDAMLLYKAKYHKYPTGNSDRKTCLGTGYPGGKCWKGEISENAAFMQELKNVYGNQLPMPNNLTLVLKGAWFSAAGTGIASTLDGVYTNFIVYSVEGDNTKCPVGPVVSDAGDSNIFTYSSTPPASGQTIPAINGESVQCWLALPA